jgi:hypothetical protein
MHMFEDEGPDDLIPDPLVAKRYHVHLSTIWRWDKDPTLKFPAAIEINRRKYRRRRELQSFERARVVARDKVAS